MTLLRITGLRYVVDNRLILEDVSLKLRAHRVGCLMGKSGCGKTTLLRCIAGLERIVGGEIEINDQLVSSSGCHLEAENRQAGVVFSRRGVVSAFDRGRQHCLWLGGGEPYSKERASA